MYYQPRDSLRVGRLAGWCKFIVYTITFWAAEIMVVWAIYSRHREYRLLYKVQDDVLQFVFFEFWCGWNIRGYSEALRRNLKIGVSISKKGRTECFLVPRMYSEQVRVGTAGKVRTSEVWWHSTPRRFSSSLLMSSRRCWLLQFSKEQCSKSVRVALLFGDHSVAPVLLKFYDGMEQLVATRLGI